MDFEEQQRPKLWVAEGAETLAALAKEAAAFDVSNPELERIFLTFPTFFLTFF